MRDPRPIRRLARALAIAAAVLILLWPVAMPVIAFVVTPLGRFGISNGSVVVGGTPGDTFQVIAEFSSDPAWLPEGRSSTTGIWYVAYPLWVPALLLAGASLILYFGFAAKAPGLCPSCGYDRRGTPAGSPCPECGDTHNA
ncbi:MAG: hypothetical protein AAF823_13675 [Planctomycetota bacterium]